MDYSIFEKAVRFIDKYMWVFHVCAFGFFLYLGIQELAKYFLAN